MPTLDELIAHHAPARDVSAATVRDAASAAPVLVVLDDDPTGTQSIHDLPVLTRWDEDDLEWALSQRVPALYVLTNTRSLDPDAAEQRNREVARAAQSVAKRLGVEISFVSRSDSTLRGHFPLETDTLVEEVEAFGGPDIDGVIIAPAFPDAGRVTVDGVHYFLDPHLGGRAVPAAETEFARDATFGYASSGLAAWVEEKTAGRNCAVDVIHLDLHTIRARRRRTARSSTRRCPSDRRHGGRGGPARGSARDSLGSEPRPALRLPSRPAFRPRPDRPRTTATAHCDRGLSGWK